MAEPHLRDVDLVAMTSHEMRVPLAAIRGFVDMLQRRRGELSDREVDEYIEVIAVQTGRLVRLVDDLSEIAELDAGSVTLEREEIVLVPFLQGLARELPDGNRVEVRVTTDLPPTIEADPLRLRQVLANLLHNALKYSPQDRPVLLAAAGEDGAAVRFEVVDEGPGIAAAELDRVFELFYRTREGARTSEGSGLGLPIARRLAVAMGGTVGVESEAGRGSRFWVRLPQAGR